jgi:hypothetical protein
MVAESMVLRVMKVLLGEAGMRESKPDDGC